MKKYVLSFNQELVMKISKDNMYLNMNDLLILQCILEMFISNSTEKLIKNNEFYVWVSRDKILEDLPILDINKNMLTKIITKLEKLELIKRTRVVKKEIGSKTYINLTELTIALLEENYLNRVIKTIEELRSVKNYTSDSIYTNIDILDTIYTTNIRSVKNYTSKEVKVKKDDLFVQCAKEIDNHTNDKNLKDVLVKFLNLVMTRKDEKKIDKLYKWKGLLNKLDRLNGDKIAIVQQSIDNNWATVDNVKYSKSTKYTGPNVFGEFSDVKSKPYTAEDAERDKKWRDENGIKPF